MKTASFIFFALFFFFALTCKKEPPIVPPPPTGPDTTSHNFALTSITFGGNYGSCYFKDATIVSDTDIWAVGIIYTSPDTVYNAVHWDGKNWNLEQIEFYTICGQSHTSAYPINAVFAFNQNDVWFTNGGEIMQWTGVSYLHYCSVGLLINGAINKIWGTSQSNLYAVGNAGTILHYSNNGWTKMESGTGYDLTDVWGSPDGTVVWVCGWRNYSVDTAQGILLRYDGTSWRTVWKRGANTTPPYGDYVSSLWCQKHVFTSTNYGVYTQSMSGVDTAVQSLSLNRFPYRIRGSSEDNVVMVGDFGMIWHYNQKDWKMLNLTDPGQPLYSVAVSTNIIVAVGGDFDIGLGAALIYMGKRE